MCLEYKALELFSLRLADRRISFILEIQLLGITQRNLTNIVFEVEQAWADAQASVKYVVSLLSGVAHLAA